MPAPAAIVRVPTDPAMIAVDPQAYRAGLAEAARTPTGPTLIDTLTDDAFLNWDGRTERALVGRLASPPEA
jgi:hypothetical protein